MQRKSYIHLYPHQEIPRGRAPYASPSGFKSSTNESEDLQTLSNQLQDNLNRSLIFNTTYLEDEDSDERTLYFSK